MMYSTVHCVWDVRATLGEGPVWSALEPAVWFVDIKQRRIHRFDIESGQGRGWDAPLQPGFLAPIDERSFVVGLQTGLHRFDVSSGTFILLREIEPNVPTNRLNDGYVDARGRLWFGSMDDNEQQTTGAVYRLDANGTLAQVDRGICITNGPCVSPDGRTFYHTDTVNRTIYASDLSDDGSLSNKRVFTRFENAEGYPDGSTVDSEGCLWTAMWGGWGVLRLSPRGERIGRVALPCANVTKAVFGGRDLRTLYITTARKGLAETALIDQPLAGGLFAVDAGVAGLPPYCVTSISAAKHWP
jgi:xylono-1,5-lactonase